MKLTNRIQGYLNHRRSSVYFLVETPDQRTALVKAGSPLLSQCRELGKVTIEGHQVALPLVFLSEPQIDWGDKFED